MNSRRVYLCVECVQDLIKEFGLARPKDADKAIAKAAEYKTRITQLTEEVKTLQSKLEAVANDLVRDVLKTTKPAAKKTTTRKAAPKK
jgi:hypothetical protein